MCSQTPIIPIKPGSVEDVLRISENLFRQGIYAPAIRPPTVKEPRIRITVTAGHTDEDIERLIEALRKSVIKLIIKNIVKSPSIPLFQRGINIFSPL